MKFCRRCKASKHPAEFGKHKRTKDGLHNFCNRCRSKESRARYVKFHKRMLERAEYYRQNRPDIMEKWRKLNKEHETRYKKSYSRLKRYGLTAEQFDRMVASQQNRCAICRKEFILTIPAVDHDHKTGKVRGLLCSKCNLALGHLEENIQTVESLRSYILNHSEVTYA